MYVFEYVPVIYDSMMGQFTRKERWRHVCSSYISPGIPVLRYIHDHVNAHNVASVATKAQLLRGATQPARGFLVLELVLLYGGASGCEFGFLVACGYHTCDWRFGLRLGTTTLGLFDGRRIRRIRGRTSASPLSLPLVVGSAEQKQKQNSADHCYTYLCTGIVRVDVCIRICSSN